MDISAGTTFSYDSIAFTVPSDIHCWEVIPTNPSLCERSHQLDVDFTAKNSIVSSGHSAIFDSALKVANSLHGQSDRIALLRIYTPSLSMEERTNLFESAKQSDSQWPLALNLISVGIWAASIGIIPMPLVSSIVQCDWTGLAIGTAGSILCTAGWAAQLSIGPTTGQTVFGAYVAMVLAGASAYIYSAFRPISIASSNREFNSALATELGVRSTTSYFLAPTIMHAHSGVLTPGLLFNLTF